MWWRGDVFDNPGAEGVILIDETEVGLEAWWCFSWRVWSREDANSISIEARCQGLSQLIQSIWISCIDSDHYTSRTTSWGCWAWRSQRA